MKLVMGILALGLSTQAVAADKICFGTGNERGEHFVLSLSKKFAEVKRASGGQVEDGKYEALAEKINGKDGKTYLQYFYSDVEGSSVLLVDESLTKAKGTGSLKLRWRGESFSQYNYFCRDDKN